MRFLDYQDVFAGFVSLLFGVPLILAGLSLFKFWLAILGFFTGISLGALLGAGLAFIMEVPGDGAFAIVALVSLLCGVFGAWISWPLQKLVVFLLSGFVVALATFALLAAAGVDGGVAGLLALFAFIGGGLLSVWAYEYLIIISMGAAGGTALFESFVTGFGGELFPSLDEMIEQISRHAWQYALIHVAAAGFALYIQRWSRPAEGADDAATREAQGVWRSAVLFGVLLVATHLGLMLVPGLHRVTMLGPLGWMVLALLLPRILSAGEEWGRQLGVPAGLGRYLSYAMVGLLITPAVGWAVDVIRFGAVDTPVAYLTVGFGESLIGFKLAYSLVVLPALGSMLVPSRERRASLPWLHERPAPGLKPQPPGAAVSGPPPVRASASWVPPQTSTSHKSTGAAAPAEPPVLASHEAPVAPAASTAPAAPATPMAPATPVAPGTPATPSAPPAPSAPSAPPVEDVVQPPSPATSIDTLSWPRRSGLGETAPPPRPPVPPRPRPQGDPGTGRFVWPDRS